MTAGKLAAILLDMPSDAEVRIMHDLTDYPVEDDVNQEDGDGGVIVVISTGLI